MLIGRIIIHIIDRQINQHVIYRVMVTEVPGEVEPVVEDSEEVQTTTKEVHLVGA